MQILKTLALCNGNTALPDVTLKKGEMAKQSTASILDLLSFPAILTRTTVTVAGWYVYACLCAYVCVHTHVCVSDFV